MPKWLLMALFLFGCVAWTGLLAAGGSGWRAGWTAFKQFGLWLGGLLLIALVVWAFMAQP